MEKKNNYESNKRWRNANREAYYKSKAKYYSKTQNACNSRVRWTNEEIKMVMAHEISDTELSKKLGRSVASIQTIRSLVKNNKR